MAIKVVQNLDPITSVGTSSVQSDPLSITTGKIRVSSNTDSIFVEVGQNPTATTSSLYVPLGKSEVIKVAKVPNCKITDVTFQNSTHTTVSVSTFGVSEVEHNFTSGDLVNITGSTDTEFNTSNATITDISSTENTITVEYDSSGNTTDYDSTGTIYYSYRVAARTENETGAGVFISEVQEEGN